MSLTMDELCGIISSNLDAEEVVELLGITTEELVARFDDKIDEQWDELQEEFTDE